MFEAIASLVVILVTLPFLGLAIARFSAREQRWMIVGFAAHVAGTAAQIWMQVYYYGYGDMLSYHRAGLRLAALMREDFWVYGSEVWLLLIQKEPQTSLWVAGIGHSTGSMNALAAYLNILTFDSLYASCILVSLLAYFGLLAMYTGLRTGVPEELQTRMLLSCLLIPSVVFWSSGIIKEAVAVAGLGFATLALYEVIHHRRVLRGGVLLLLGAGLMAISKAYLLGPFALGAIAWMVIYFARQTNRDIARFATPGYAIIGIALAMFCIVAIGEVFPRYSINNFAEEVTHLQTVGARTEGGSNYALVGDDVVDRTMTQQLMFAPQAVIMALFRPFIFEVNNPFALMSALEASFAILVLLLALKRSSLSDSWRRIYNSPTLMYCLVIVLLVALGVGLTTTNFGTLSRYRIPMMPMYFVLVTMILPTKLARRR